MKDTFPAAGRIRRRSSVVGFAAMVMVLWAAGFVPRTMPARASADEPQTRTLRIRVFDEDGQPVEGAAVLLRSAAQGGSAETDDEGNAALELAGPPPAWMQVTIDKEPYSRQSARWQPGTDANDLPPAELVFRLAPGRTIGGRVVDERMKPVAGATVSGHVSVEVPDDHRVQIVLNFEVVTEADGTWSASRAPAAVSQASLQVRHPDFASDAFLSAVDRKAVDLLFESKHQRIMPKGVAVFGRVTDQKGKPVEGALVGLGQHSPTTARQQTDAEGWFRIEHSLPGQSALTVIKPGLAPEFRAITIGAGEADNEFKFELKPGHSIRIRLKDKAGRPVAGAGVWPGAWRDGQPLWNLHSFPQTDAEGLWEWDWAPAEEIKYGAYKASLMRLQDVALRPQREPHELTLDPELHITGKVVDEATGESIAKFTMVPGIARWNGVASKHWNRWEAAVGRNGEYSVRLSQPYDRHALRVEADGYLPAESREIRNDEGEIAIDFRLKRGRQPEGTVLSPEGQPEAGANVILATSTNRAYVRESGASDRDRGISVQSGADGTFKFPPQSEDFSVFVCGESGFGQASSRLFERAANEPVRVTLKPWARIRGQVVNGKSPLADQPVRLTFTGTMQGTGQPSYFLPYAHFDFRARTDGHGRFRFDRVPPESQAIVAHAIVIRFDQGSTEAWGHRAEFKLAPGQIRSITLGGTGRRLAGRAVLSASAEVNWETQFGSLRPVGEQKEADIAYSPPAAFRIQHDGAFRIEDVAPGKYVLSIRAERPRSLDRPLSEPIGVVEKTITVPDEPDDELVDLGTVTVHIKTPPAPLLKAAELKALVPRARGQAETPFRLERQIVDSAGSPVSGAKATIWYVDDGPPKRLTAKADALGKIQFHRVPGYGAWLFADALGFRFQGAYVDGGAPAGTFKLVRESEPAEAAPAASADGEISQALRARFLRSLRELADAMMQGDNEQSKWGARAFLAQYDPDFAIEHAADKTELSGAPKEVEPFARWQDASFRAQAARHLAPSDPERALQALESISDPDARAAYLTSAAGALPAGQREIALEWLRLARRGALELSESTLRAERLASIGGELLRLGDRETARAVLREAAAEARKPSDHDRADFARAMVGVELSPLDLKAALELVPVPLGSPGRDKQTSQELTGKLAQATDAAERKRLEKALSAGWEHDRYYGGIAFRIAQADPDEAERLLAALGDRRDELSVKVCAEMATVDVPRARRIAARIARPSSRAHALGVMADALAQADKELACELLRQSFDLLTEQADDGAEDTNAWHATPLQIAISLMPTVERIDPQLVHEYLWHALSLRQVKTCQGAGGWRIQQLGRIGSQPVRAADALLAAAVVRYDKPTARLLALAPGDGALGLPLNEGPEFFLAALALLDPQMAIEVADRLPAAAPDEIQQKLQVWSQMIPLLTLPPADRWNWLIDNYLRVWRVGKMDL